jgi:hypothetical protein
MTLPHYQFTDRRHRRCGKQEEGEDRNGKTGFDEAKHSSEISVCASARRTRQSFDKKRAKFHGSTSSSQTPPLEVYFWSAALSIGEDA